MKAGGDPPAFGNGGRSPLPLRIRASASHRGTAAYRRLPSSLDFIREHKTFASTEGADLDQTLNESGGGIWVLAVSDDEVQRRSYPTPVRQQGAAGWEFVQALNLPDQGERVAAEAVALLTADPCPAGTTTLIIGAEQMALQVHESVGTILAELDRVFGAEAAYAGPVSHPGHVGRFQFGSPVVNLTADATSRPAWARLAGMTRACPPASPPWCGTASSSAS